MYVLPTAICANSDQPPEIEVRFDLKKPEFNKNKNYYDNCNENENKNVNDDKNEMNEINIENYYNWQLKFVHNQLFENLNNSNRFCPGTCWKKKVKNKK